MNPLNSRYFVSYAHTHGYGHSVVELPSPVRDVAGVEALIAAVNVSRAGNATLSAYEKSTPITLLSFQLLGGAS